MDYRDLLVRYMALVIHEESIDYLWRSNKTELRPAWFTDAEMDELEKISDEAVPIEESFRQTERTARNARIEAESLRFAAKTHGD